MLLRHNISQALTADMHGISQSTVSRTWPRMMPLLTHVLVMSGISLGQGGLLLIDSTPIPTGNRPEAGKQVEKADFGQAHAQCLGVQVAVTTDAILVAVSDPVPGSRHGSAALSLCGWDGILAGADWIADTAYTAHGALTPIKKIPTQSACYGRKSSTRPYHLCALSSRVLSPHLKNGRSCQPVTASG